MKLRVSARCVFDGMLVAASCQAHDDRDGKMRSRRHSAGRETALSILSLIMKRLVLTAAVAVLLMSLTVVAFRTSAAPNDGRKSTYSDTLKRQAGKRGTLSNTPGGYAFRLNEAGGLIIRSIGDDYVELAVHSNVEGAKTLHRLIPLSKFEFEADSN